MFYNQPHQTITSSVALLAATTNAQVSYLERNDKRANFILSMTGTARAYVLYGDNTPSSNLYSFYMDDGDLVREEIYNGPVSVVFSTTTGSLAVTETFYP